MKFIDDLDIFLQSFASTNNPVVFCRDININTLTDNLLALNYGNTLISNGLALLITRVTESSSTSLDRFAEKNIPESFIMENQNYVDHFPIHLGFCPSQTWSDGEDFRETNFLTRKLENSSKIQK